MDIITTSNATATRHVTRSETPDTPGIEVGISACLLGKEVRYNGGHSQSKMCQNELSQHFRFRSFCPEMAAGFGVPRPTLRLTGDPAKPTLVFSNDQSRDVTQQLTDAIDPVLQTLDPLDGYILMKNSPSCGLDRIKVYQDNGYPHTQRSQGLFTTALQQRYPDLPIEEEGRLHDAHLRENFILRVFAHNHFRGLVDADLSLHNLMRFHRDYKYVLMAHNQPEYRSLGKLLAETHKHADLVAVRREYHHRFMVALSTPASRRGHCNALLHLLGYLKRSVGSSARRDIVAVIDSYRNGDVNLTTPLTLIRHYVQQFGSEYVRTQRYLQPHPARLGLHNQL